MRLKSISLLGVLCFLLLAACTAEPPKEIRSGEVVVKSGLTIREYM